MGRASTSHKRFHELPDVSREELEEMSAEDESSQSLVHSPPALRKRKISETEFSKSDDESETSMEDDVVGEMSEEKHNQTRSRKRPRSLRVSLTLPPCVETTPIGNNKFSLTPKLPTANLLSDTEQTVSTPVPEQSVQSDTSLNDLADTTVHPSIEPPKKMKKQVKWFLMKWFLM